MRLGLCNATLLLVCWSLRLKQDSASHPWERPICSRLSLGLEWRCQAPVLVSALFNISCNSSDEFVLSGVVSVTLMIAELQYTESFFHFLPLAIYHPLAPIYHYDYLCTNLGAWACYYHSLLLRHMQPATSSIRHLSALGAERQLPHFVYMS